MFYKILTQIVDHDAKGEIGSGTQYRLTIENNNLLVEQYDYSIMDIITGVFNPDVVKNKYIKLNDEIAVNRDKELLEAIKKAKADALANKMKSSTPAGLTTAIDDVIASNAPIVEQYRNGNDKVLNALVGQTMKKYKGDPAVIKQLLIDHPRLKGWISG